MVEYETIKSEKIKFGRNNFIEVARRKAKISPEEENIYISIARGYYLPDGTERIRKTVSLPDDEELKKFISEKILEV